MRRITGMAAVCAVSFGVAFAAGSMTRDSHRQQAVSRASAPAPVRVAPLASAPGLPGLRVAVAPRRRPSAPRPAVTLAAAVTRPRPNRGAQVVAQTPRPSAPTPRPKRAPTAAASGPSVAFFDEGE